MFSTNLKYLRTKYGMEQIELANKLGRKSGSSVSEWEKGTYTPKIKTVAEIANIFNVDLDDMMNIDLSSKTLDSTHSAQAPQNISKDVLKLDKELHSEHHASWICYGNTLLEEQQSEHLIEETSVIYYTYDFYPQPASAGTGQYLGDTPVEQIDLPVDVKADFVIPITGDSMEPEYHDCDYVFIKSTVTLNDGDIGVFEFCGESYIKQLLITPSGAFLHSLNDKYEDIPIHADSDFRIIGRVVGKYEN